MLAGEVHHLRDFRLRHFVCIDPTNTDPLLMDMHHDPIGFIVGFVEETLKHEHNEIHRGIVVIEQEHLVKTGFLCFWLRFCNDSTALIFVIAMTVFFGHEDIGDSLAGPPDAFAASFMFASVPHDANAMMQ